jgi:hypothetical protein
VDIWVDSTKPKTYHGDTEVTEELLFLKSGAELFSEIPNEARDPYSHDDLYGSLWVG